jgi:hypothetical protein
MYQLDRLLTTQEAKRDFPATILGKAWGIGIASYAVSQDFDKALYDLWLAYSPKLEDAKRTEAVCANLLRAAVPAMDLLLQDWEVLTFEGKPAVELGFRLNIDSSYYFVGYMDFVMRNRWTGRSAVFDAKTTTLNFQDLAPAYQNSPQLIGYSIVLDQIVGASQSEYDVCYFSGKLGSGNGFSPEIKPYFFPKTLQDRLQWFISLGMDVNHLKEMASLGIYPMRGESCIQFMRPCKHFGVCQLHSFDQPASEEPDLQEYQFVYQLEDVIADHIKRISA